MKRIPQDTKTYQNTRFNDAQLQYLNALSLLESPEEVEALNRFVLKLLNERLQKELNKMWDSGELSQEILDKWGKEHFRTPYNK